MNSTFKPKASWAATNDHFQDLSIIFWSIKYISEFHKPEVTSSDDSLCLTNTSKLKYFQFTLKKKKTFLPFIGLDVTLNLLFDVICTDLNSPQISPHPFTARLQLRRCSSNTQTSSSLFEASFDF